MIATDCSRLHRGIAASMLGEQFPQILQSAISEGEYFLLVSPVDPETAVFGLHVEREIQQQLVVFVTSSNPNFRIKRESVCGLPIQQSVQIRRSSAKRKVGYVVGGIRDGPDRPAQSRRPPNREPDGSQVRWLLMISLHRRLDAMDPEKLKLLAYAQDLRHRAEEISTRADVMRTADAQAMMRRIAASYEKLAQRLEKEAGEGE